MNKYILVGLTLAGGLISAMAWTGPLSGLVLLFSLSPFLIVGNYLYIRRKYYNNGSYFLYILPGFLAFVMTSMGWMREASLTGAVFVITGLAFLMSLSLWLAHIVRIKHGTLAGIIAVYAFWLTFEFLSLNVSFISPWLNLGNGLARDIRFIQWYEYTGVSGGSFWILTSNLLLTLIFIKKNNSRRQKILLSLSWMAIIAIPVMISFSIDKNVRKQAIKGDEVILIQPNFDPYTVKFTVPFSTQLDIVLKMAATAATSKTSWILTPETIIDDPVDLDSLKQNSYIRAVRTLAGQYQSAAIVTGMVTLKRSSSKETDYFHWSGISDSTAFITDYYNSALRIDTSSVIEFYHKSKLVPGIELVYGNGAGRLLSRILPYLGGTHRGYSSQERRSCLSHHSLDYMIAPVICYESVFGNYVADYIREGAGAIFIMTNDGWWKNSRGYLQHLAFASLRAVETRRPVARAGNTGISCFIDIRGRIIASTQWWNRTVLKGEIVPDNRMTFYTRHGDYILTIALITSALITLYSIISIFFRKKNRQK